MNVDPRMGLIESHPYFQGLDAEILRDVARHVEVREFEVAEVVFPANKPMTEIGFLVGGRLKGVFVDAHGEERLLRFAERGEAIGMIGAAMNEPVPVEVVAVEPSRLLMLDYEVAFDLTTRYRELRRHWSRIAAGFIGANMLGDAPRKKTSVVAFFHQTPATRILTRTIVHHLRDLGENVALLSDQRESCFDDEIPYRCAHENDRWMNETELHQQLAAWGKPNRIVVDFDGHLELARVKQVVSLCHNVLWVTTAPHADAAYRHLREVQASSPAFRDKLSLVWILEEGQLPPVTPPVRELISRDFKVTRGSFDDTARGKMPPGLVRVIHFLRGIQIGLALGGGAARGMAHLGVLRALDEQGIVIDQIAGTSAGAMTGVLYGAGLEPDYLIDSFVHDLRPSWLFRQLPRGGYWYLMYKYRWGRFDPMLRNYLFDLKLEQLPIPCSAVTIDLVSGEALVRRSDDAVQAILESINLPVLSRPIMRQGRALIDGGFVNNVPADVLASQGCNLVIAVDVTAKIEKNFGSRDPAKRGDVRAPNSMQTLLRTYAVQSYNMNSVGVQPADVRIEPDVSQFSMAAFTQAREMSVIGEQATLEKLPTLQRLLARLDHRGR